MYVYVNCSLNCSFLLEKCELLFILPKVKLVTLSMAVLSENRSDMFAQKLFHTTAELQWLKYLWNHEKMFETGIVGAVEC